MEVSIDADKFFARIDRLFTEWNNHKASTWGGAEALCIPLGNLLLFVILFLVILFAVFVHIKFYSTYLQLTTYNDTILLVSYF